MARDESVGVVNFLPYGKQSIDDDDVRAVVTQLKSDWLTQGPAVAQFEASLCAATGAKYAVAVANGTAALHLACLAAGVKEGDTGVTSDITFAASANCIRYAGGTPVLVDVDAHTAHMRLDGLANTVDDLVRKGRSPKVIIPVSFSGSVFDLPAARAIAARACAIVIEDAAHSLGAEYTHDGQTSRSASCLHSDMAILSFHPVKHITTGEGGAITTNDGALYKKLCLLRSHGITKDPAELEAHDGPWYQEQHALGFNYRLTDLQSALGVSQMTKLDAFVERRRVIAARYDAAFAGAKGVKSLGIRSGTRSSYHLYVVSLDTDPNESNESLRARRKAFFLAMRERGIGGQVHYVPVHGHPDYRRNGLSNGTFEGAERYYASCMSLPMYPALTESDVERVIESALTLSCR